MTIPLSLGSGPLERVERRRNASHVERKNQCAPARGRDRSISPSSAGGHWNPTAEDHGQWDTQPFHLGDIGNVVVDEEGKGSLSLITDRWSMGGGGANDILGKAVVVHADPDDFKTQPSGAAGARIGCGVIGKR